MPIGMVNFSRKYDGVAICTDIYYRTLLELGYDVNWYQFYDYREPQNYLDRPKMLKGSRFPVSGIRAGYDRLIKVPSSSSHIAEDYLFLADPTLLRLGFKKKGFMVKIHDLIPLSKYRDLFSSRLMFKYAIPRIDEADVIIVTTEYMKGNVGPFVKNSNKVFVVPDPIDLKARENHLESSLSRINSGRINLLYVAADRPYKNIQFFFEIAKHFQERNLRDFSFILVSKIGEKSREVLRGLNLTNLHVYENVSDISTIYDQSDILVNTSFQEGFGRPLVEAMSCGIPSIASKKRPFTDILGDSAVLVDDFSLDSWEDAILKLSEGTSYSHYSNSSAKRYKSFYSREVFRKKLKVAFNYFLETNDKARRTNS